VLYLQPTVTCTDLNVHWRNTLVIGAVCV